MKLLLAVLSAIVLFSLLSCEVACSKAELQFGLIGFSDTESDTIILRRFTKNGGGSTLIDTFLLAGIRYRRNQDSLTMVAFPGNAVLTSNYDYDIFFPGPGKLIRITDMNEEQLYMKPRGKVGCVNRISSYKLNGQLINNITFNITYFTK
jgi:hypothetical protein